MISLIPFRKECEKPNWQYLIVRTTRIKKSLEADAISRLFALTARSVMSPYSNIANARKYLEHLTNQTHMSVNTT